MAKAVNEHIAAVNEQIEDHNKRVPLWHQRHAQNMTGFVIECIRKALKEEGFKTEQL